MKRDFKILEWMEAVGLGLIGLAILIVLTMSSCGKGETYCEYSEEGVPCVWLDPANKPVDSSSYKTGQINLLEGSWRLQSFSYQSITQTLDEKDVVIWTFNDSDDLTKIDNKDVSNFRFGYSQELGIISLWDGSTSGTYYTVDQLDKDYLTLEISGYSYEFTRL